MSRATEITTSRRGDVTNARDKQTVLCPLLISNYWTGGCCELKCAWFYCLLRSYKSTLQLCGLSEHVDVAFITNQKWVWLLSDCYVLWKVLVQVMHAVFQESARCYIECSLYMHNMLLRRLNIPHMRNKWRLVNIYTPACTAILVFTGFLAQPRCSVTWCHVTGLFHSRVNLIVLFLCCFF